MLFILFFVFLSVFLCIREGDTVMKPITVYNNNAVLVDDNGVECVIIGNGVGFGLKNNNIIDESKIDKKYYLDADFTQNKFGSLMAEIEEKYVILTFKVIKEAEKQLGQSFNKNSYILIADHINYAIKRNKNGEVLKNDLLWEIKKYYPREYRVARQTIQYIERSEKVKFEEDEVGFIALHFVNSSSSFKLKNETIFTTKLIRELIQIIEINFNMKLDESTINYDRFMTHIRYFVSRVFSNEKHDSHDNELLNQVKRMYPKAYSSGLKIKKHIDTLYKIKISNSELLYFVIHINRITSREKLKK